MKLVIVSGLSGSGKSIALHALEDLDYYCVDNLPIGLLVAFANQIIDIYQGQYRNFAVGIDVRNLTSDLHDFGAILAQLRAKHIECEVIFLEAQEAALIKRFSETRRKHPLTSDDMPLTEAISTERQMLDPIASHADLVIDTTRTNVHQLRQHISTRVGDTGRTSLSLQLLSFGYKHGVPVDADFVFDVRCIPNPHWVPELRAKTGLDRDVIAFLEKHPAAERMFDDLKRFLETWIPHFEADSRSYMTVAIGCTGGQHRSVYLVEKLAQHLRQNRESVLTQHRDLQ
ncbi:MAG: RNase adapter RapZ [Pseudomonadota bacterium]|nr:MAG: RNase adapter RapZ [Pseudomonadota bacterium]